MSRPTQCRLWQKENLTDADLISADNFEVLHTFVDESHLCRQLVKCKECGQLYFYEFYEEIDWKEGNDPQYCTFIPVETRDQAETMARVSPLELLRFGPRLQKDWPADEDNPTIRWVGR